MVTIAPERIKALRNDRGERYSCHLLPHLWVGTHPLRKLCQHSVGERLQGIHHSIPPRNGRGTCGCLACGLSGCRCGCKSSSQDGSGDSEHTLFHKTSWNIPVEATARRRHGNAACGFRPESPQASIARVLLARFSRSDEQTAAAMSGDHSPLNGNDLAQNKKCRVLRAAPRSLDTWLSTATLLHATLPAPRPLRTGTT